MFTPSPVRLLVAVFVSVLAGAINSIAAGGTLLTFPVLIGLGIPPIMANATSTVALVPGSLGSVWGYRAELRGAREWALALALPSAVGGLIGALLLLRTPPATFSRLVPWLVFGATGLFILQGPLSARLRRRATAVPVDPAVSPRPTTPLILYQGLVAIYGGYFGAGVGILMLAAFGLMGLTNIHRMNGLKNWAGVCMNTAAVITFAVTGVVNWPVALTMAIGAVGGGYIGSRTAQRVGQKPVRLAIVAVGVGAGVWLLVTG